MRYREIIENVEQGVSIDMLPASVKQDILDMMLGPNGPETFEPFWMKTYGVMSFTETYLSQFFFGDENLHETGGYDGDTIKVNMLELNPRELYSENRGVSDLAVSNYAAMSTTPPPVLARREGDRWKLVEGGHRIAAAVQRGTSKVRVVDVTSFWATDWENM